MLSPRGDVVIHNNKIVMVEDNDLLIQTCKTVLGTNKGEWPLNLNEGITFANILGKNKTEEMIKFEVEDGLQQVDETFELTAFELVNNGNRSYTVNAAAQNANGEEVIIDTDYGTITSTALKDDEYEDDYYPSVPKEENESTGITSDEVRAIIRSYDYQTAAQVNSAIDTAVTDIYQVEAMTDEEIDAIFED